MQTGLCDISIAATDITAPLIVPIEARPPKRPFTEIDEDAGEEPNSDELYGWIEDDEVATEGLLIDEAPINEDDAARPRLDVVAEGHRKKVSRTSPACFWDVDRPFWPCSHPEYKPTTLLRRNGTPVLIGESMLTSGVSSHISPLLFRYGLLYLARLPIKMQISHLDR